MIKECEKIDYIRIGELIEKFSKIILTKNDDLSIEDAKIFIDSLTNEDKACLNSDNPENNSQLRLIIQTQITKYLETYDHFSASESIKLPFEFDNGRNYSVFSSQCEEYYRKKNNKAHLPAILDFTLTYIQEMSEHYRIFGSFYKVRSKETANEIMLEMSKTAAEQAKLAVKQATEDAAKDAVERKISIVTEKVSETSVTILGIFAGIVLAVVGGMFYSSSVMENLYHTNLDKLICIAALVGFIFFNLIVILFRYVERIRNSGRVLETNDTQEGIKRFFAWIKHHKIDILVVLVNIALICLLFLSYGKVNENNSTSQDTENTESTECVFLDETK